MTSLTERAEQAATGPAPASEPEYAPQPAAMPDPMADYEPGDDDPEMVPVGVAWLRVRRDIRAIGKAELYNQSGTKFNFRGVDTVVNVFGPVTLKHGIHIMSSKVEATYGEKSTKSGGKMRECSVLVTWTVMGPMGDTFTLQTMGEALDTADKSTTKAQSVALRTLLLGFGLTPTHDKDPDADRIERGEAPTRSAIDYRDEIVNPQTTPGRLEQIGYELRTAGMLHVLVQNEVGEQETLDALGLRTYKERTAAPGGAS
jgi:hypothetical protein